MLSQAKASPDITNYLTFILCSQPPSFDLSNDDLILARSAAAVTLKNLVGSRHDQIPTDKRTYVQASILKCVGDPNLQIRNFVGNVITEVVKKGGVMGWPQVYSELFALAGNEKTDASPNAPEGAMSALAKICEDNKRALDREYSGQRPLDEFMPRLYQLLSSPNAKIRVLALQSLNVFIPSRPTALLNSVDTLLTQLFRLAHDDHNDVRRFVCRAFVQLVEASPSSLIPHMEGLVTYMIAQQQSSDIPELALEAAEYWLGISEQDKICDSLGPYLDKVVPVLLSSMVYSEEDIARHENDRDDAEEEDRQQDIKPQFATSMKGLSEGLVKQNGTNGQDQAPGAEDELSDGEIPEKDSIGDDDPEDEWNLRKCSAAALDGLASHFPNQVFEISLPYLKGNLTKKEWPRREAAVLAFGAIADGCEAVVAPYLPELIPFLRSLLDDSEPVVRKITCWALGRYTKWVISLPPTEMQRYLEMIIDGILKKMLDRNKAVQESAASAFTNVEETAKSCLIPYCQPIVQQFVKCFDLYKDRNMFILYDCIQTLAENVGITLAQPEVQGTLMSALTARWQKTSDETQELISIQECLSYIANAMGEFFTPYAEPIFSRCTRIVHHYLERQARVANDSAIDLPPKDFCMTSLDLLSGICQAIPRAKCGELIDAAKPNLFDLLQFCMADPNLDVRQSAYALLGDLAIHLPERLSAHVPALMPRLLAQIDVAAMPDVEAEDSWNVVNNACWALGELVQDARKAAAPFVAQTRERLFGLVASAEVPSAVAENAAIALGRLGLRFAPELAPHLPTYARQLLEALAPVASAEEKGQCLLGFNHVVALNPVGLAECMIHYLRMAVEMSISKVQVENLMSSFQQVRLIDLGGKMICSMADWDAGAVLLQGGVTAGAPSDHRPASAENAAKAHRELQAHCLMFLAYG